MCLAGNQTWMSKMSPGLSLAGVMAVSITENCFNFPTVLQLKCLYGSLVLPLSNKQFDCLQKLHLFGKRHQTGRSVTKFYVVNP